MLEIRKEKQMLYTHYIQKNLPNKKEIELNKLLGIPGPKVHARNFAETQTLVRPISYRSKPLEVTEQELIPKLTILEKEYNELIKSVPVEELYQEFYIPKHSGGFRKIEAPIQPLLELQRRLLDIMQNEIGAIHHNAAFAYVKNRSIKNALEVHQANNSRWFLKLDIKNFFGSITTDLIEERLREVYPYAHMSDYTFRCFMYVLTKLGTIDDRLPQGTPISPHLSNLIMVQADYATQRILKQTDESQYYPYTRYADDIIISGRRDFEWRKIQNNLAAYYNDHYGFELKISKTRYGSRNGRNWNLGLMLNKDNNITIGHKTKDKLKAILFNFIKDYDTIDIDTAYFIQGKLSYYSQIEPEYVNGLLKHLESKHNTRKPIRELLNDIIKV
jgi:hypothetical protein